MHVAILIQSPVSLFELGYAVELFALPAGRYPNWYQTDVVTFAAGPQQGIAGVSLQVKDVNNLDRYQMLVVPAWSIQNSTITKPMTDAILKLQQREGRILSYCTGAFLLAELGLLDNKNATTHWAYAQDFKTRYPRVHYIDNVLYVYDGKLGCSAGSAAGIDLSLEVIREDFGYRIANQIARRLVMSPHRSGGQSQFVETPMLKAPSRFSAAIDWAFRHLAEKISVDQLAQQALMSRRSFDRKFKAAFGLSSQQWLIRQRIEKAKVLLEETDVPIERVATLVGFETAMTMRHHFKHVLTLSPRQYREQFGHNKKRLVQKC